MICGIIFPMELIANRQSQKRYSISQYFEIEYASEIRHEFRAGEIVAMAGGTVDHARIAFNVATEVGRNLRGKPCRGYSNDLRIGVPPTPFFYYPDLSVVCGPLQHDSRDPKSNSVINPRLIIEVLSPSTELYDRTDKFDQYIKLESLEEYVLISQDAPCSYNSVHRVLQ